MTNVGGASKQPMYLQLADQVRQEILAGRYAAGEPLPTEYELGVLLGASRTTVREALRALQAEGLIMSAGGAPARAVVAKSLDRPARDALVRMLRLERVELQDLVDLRSVLESAAMRRAAARQDRVRLAEAEDALGAMAEGGVSVKEFEEADVQFHVALVRASGNEAMHLMMLALRDPVEDHLYNALVQLPDPVPTLRRLTREHAQILDAVMNGDGEGAADMVDRHIRGFYASSGAPAR